MAFKDNYYERRTLYAVDLSLAYRSVDWLEDKLIELNKLAQAMTNKYTVNKYDTHLLKEVAEKLDRAQGKSTTDSAIRKLRELVDALDEQMNKWQKWMSERMWFNELGLQVVTRHFAVETLF